MIDYNRGTISLICKFRGSVFPSAFIWALPASVLAYSAFYVFYSEFEEEHPNHSNLLLAVWTALTGSLGFLIVFRTQQAYARYWEGATLLRTARGQWFNAASCLIAFCSKSPSVGAEVEKFQHLLVRLMSLLSCASLQMIADTDSEVFCVISLQGISTHSLEFLKSKRDRHQRVEVVMQWVQRLVVDALEEGVISVPPPILTRFFQELGMGSVSMNQARNLSDLPFPFPYAQLIAFLLILHFVSTPVVCGLLLQSGVAASALTFAAVFTFQGINCIASEIESPFGEDLNDLPLALMQQDFNSSLWILLENQAKYYPTMNVSMAEVHRAWSVEEIRFSETSRASRCSTSRDPSDVVAHRVSLDSIGSMLGAKKGGVFWFLKHGKGSHGQGSFMARKSMRANAINADPSQVGVAPQLSLNKYNMKRANSSLRQSSALSTFGTSSRPSSHWSRVGTNNTVPTEPMFCSMSPRDSKQTSRSTRSRPFTVAGDEDELERSNGLKAPYESDVLKVPSYDEAKSTRESDSIDQEVIESEQYQTVRT